LAPDQSGVLLLDACVRRSDDTGANQLRFDMRAALLKLSFRLFSLLPLRAAHALGAALGWLFSHAPNKRLNTARVNLALCFPELSDRERQRLLHASVREYLKGFAEIGVLWTRAREPIRALVTQVSGEDEVKRLLAAGRGLIVAVPHLGAWEMVGLYCAMHYPMTSLYRAPRLAELDTLMRQARERFGSTLVPTDQRGIRALYKALGRGALVAILPDQVPGREAGSVFAPFFGIPASTMVLLSRLAQKTRAAVVFAYAERLARGQGYHLHFLPAPAEIYAEDLTTSATAVNAMVEHCVRACPAQYQWVYKRFRVRPPGAKPFY
jgi:KDO2-lipid IV(A) lauroyltransferase